MNRSGEPQEVGLAVAACATGALSPATGIHIIGGGLRLHRV